MKKGTGVIMGVMRYLVVRIYKEERKKSKRKEMGKMIRMIRLI